MMLVFPQSDRLQVSFSRLGSPRLIRLGSVLLINNGLSFLNQEMNIN
jgi:hypothetical protein